MGKKAERARRSREWPLLVVGGLMIVVSMSMLAAGVLGGLGAARRSDAVLAELAERPRTPSVDHSATGANGDKGAMPAEIVEGNEYIGTIEFPTMDLRLPVAGYYSDELLRVSPCRYEGSYVTNDLVVGGEGYASHFGRIGTLGIRDEVRLTTVDRVLIRYVVSNVETDRLEDITAILHDWDLTLFTFNADGTCCVVRCVRTE
jgi:sortase A